MDVSVPIEFKCQSCQKTLRVADEFAGRKAKCPNCQTVLQVEDRADVFESLAPAPTPTPFESELPPLQQPPVGQPGIPNASPFATGNPYGAPSHVEDYRRFSGAPHRGGLVLGLGIGAFFCNVFLIPGILAFVFGLSDLRKMREGKMDREGHGMTLAGTILGGIMTVMTGLVVLFYILIFVIAVVGNL